MVCKALEKVDVATALIGQVPVWELERAGLTVVSEQTLEALLKLAAWYRVENNRLSKSLVSFRAEVRAKEEQNLINCLLETEEVLSIDQEIANSGPSLVSSRAIAAELAAVLTQPSSVPKGPIFTSDPVEPNPLSHELEQIQDVSV